jgi:hypothetical protein
MPLNTRHTLRTIAGLLLLAMLSISAMQAAETVRWQDLDAKIQKDRHNREYTVITRSGEKFRGFGLGNGPEGIRFHTPGPTIPKEDIVEIRIRYSKLFSDALIEPGGAVLFGNILSPWTTVLIPVSIGAMVVSAPVVSVIEGVKHLRPTRVIKIVP